MTWRNSSTFPVGVESTRPKATCSSPWSGIGPSRVKARCDPTSTRCSPEPDIAQALTTFVTVLLSAILAPTVVGMRRLVAAESDRFPDIAGLYLRTSWHANIDALAGTLSELDRARLIVDEPSIAAEQLVWMSVGASLNARTLGCRPRCQRPHHPHRDHVPRPLRRRDTNPPSEPRKHRS